MAVMYSNVILFNFPPATDSRIFQELFWNSCFIFQFPGILFGKCLVAEDAEVECFLGDLLLPQIGFLHLRDKGERRRELIFDVLNLFLRTRDRIAGIMR